MKPSGAVLARETLLKLPRLIFLLVTCCATAIAATSARESDIQSLLAFHARDRDAHLKGDANLLAAGMAAQVTNARKGKVEIASRDEMRHRFTQYFAQVTYTTWDDTVPPKVHVSADGTMAWMVIEMRARLSDRSGPNAGVERGFVSSWIAIYERQKGEWRMVGISSDVVEL